MAEEKDQKPVHKFVKKLPEELSVARAQVAQIYPYFTSGLYRLIPVETNLVPTMAVDEHWRLYFNPDTVKEWTLPERVGVLVHEIFHLYRSHLARAQSFLPFRGTKEDDPVAMKKWNLATDAEVNDDACFTSDQRVIRLPKGAVYPATLKCKPNLTAEEYFDQMKVEVVEICLQGAGQHGSNNGGKGGDWEIKGQSKDEPGVSGDESELIFAQSAKDYEQAKKEGRLRGSQPGWMEEWVKQILGRGKVPWQKVLRTYVKQVITFLRGKNDFSFSKRSRKNLDKRLIVPGMVGEDTIVADVLVDTSGSMDDKLLAECLGEISHLLRLCNMTHANLHAGDVRVVSTEKVTLEKLRKGVKLGGRGGTDMAQCIRQIEEKTHPRLIIVLTDGYTPWPESQNVAKVVACIFHGRGYDCHERVPGWIKTVKVEVVED